MTYEDRPAVKANGTVKPSAKPMIMSRMMSPWSECCSGWGRERLDFERMSVGKGRSDGGSTVVEVIALRNLYQNAE